MPPIECLTTSCKGMGKCEPGHTGPLCTNCKKGWGRSGQLECGECHSAATWWTIFFSGLGGMYIVIAYYTYSNVKYAFRHSQRWSVALKVFWSYIHFNGIAAAFEYKWPSVVHDLLEAQAQMGSGASSLFSLDCILSTKDFGATDYISPFFIKSGLFLAVPLLLVLFSFSIGVLVYFFRLARGLPDPKATAQTYFIVSLVVSLFLVHPEITAVGFQMFACKTLDYESGTQYLVNDPTIICFGDEHALWMVFVGLPMLILWYVFSQQGCC